jgi:tRNA pseudouridine13 synthase
MDELPVAEHQGLRPKAQGHIPNPLPTRYQTVQPGLGGAIKLRAEDFLVDEIPLYEPVGAGEHIYLGIQKRGVSHAELMAVISRTLGVPRNRIGFAGMKDKQAITRQTVSVHLHKDPPSIELDHERISVLWSMRHRNRLRRGHLRGNRFSIRIRDVEPLRAPAAQAVLRDLEQSGVPNFYGPQRFGYRGNTHLLGIMLLKGECDALAAELLGTTGSPFPEHQRPQRELFDQGRLQEALPHWSVADRAEKSVLQKLIQGASAHDACNRLDRAIRNFWVSALQSAVFNRALEQRMSAGTLGALVEGDLAWKHDNGSVFRVTPEELASGALERRLAAKEISPSGPIWGRGMTRAADAVGQVEEAALNEFGITVEEIASNTAADEGARRPLRIPLKLPEIDAGVDEHGGYIRLAFELPPGAYATIVTREVMKNAHEDEEAE